MDKNKVLILIIFLTLTTNITYAESIKEFKPLTLIPVRKTF